MWLTDWLKRMNGPEPDAATEHRLRLLAVSIWLNDRLVLESLGKAEGWEMRFTNAPGDAFRLVAHKHFDVILCDSNQPGYPWREVMERVADLSPRSRILLVSPANDDFLWSDVVQQGGYGVLTRPLREADARHAISAAAGQLSMASSECQ